MWSESTVFIKRTPKSWRPDVYVLVSVLQQITLFNFFVNALNKKCGGRSSRLCFLWPIRNTEHAESAVFCPA